MVSTRHAPSITREPKSPGSAFRRTLAAAGKKKATSTLSSTLFDGNTPYTTHTMETRSLRTAADRAMRSCSLLRSRLASLTPNTPRHFSSTSPASIPASPRDRHAESRWESAPPALVKPGAIWGNTLGQGRMPFKLRNPSQPVFKVIADDEAGNKALDEMYTRFLGRGGELLLPKEVKWLAITHKSFDHGWQGSNDRLAFLGKRLVDMQISLALMNMPRLPAWGEEEKERLTGLENVTPLAKTRVSERRRIAALARQMGIQEVMRWKPRKVSAVFLD